MFIGNALLKKTFSWDRMWGSPGKNDCPDLAEQPVVGFAQCTRVVFFGCVHFMWLEGAQAPGKAPKNVTAKVPGTGMKKIGQCPSPMGC